MSTTTKATKIKVNITIDGTHYKLDRDEISGAELKQLAGIAELNLLFREVRGPGDDEQIADETVVHLKSGDKFYDMPQGNFGRI
jgi:Multiubiquitin